MVICCLAMLNLQSPNNFEDTNLKKFVLRLIAFGAQ